jgi:hypothetical protein
LAASNALDRQVEYGTEITGGYIDHSGEFVIPARFKYADEFLDDLARVCVAGLFANRGNDTAQFLATKQEVNELGNLQIVHLDLGLVIECDDQVGLDRSLQIHNRALFKEASKRLALISLALYRFVSFNQDE